MRFWIALLCLAAALAASARALAADPPYADVYRWDWFYNYVEVLRQEEITDGHYGWVWTARGLVYVCYYYPSDYAGRAEYVLMMSKAFRLKPDPGGQLPFPDVPPSLLLYDRVPARSWLAAAFQAGFVQGRDDGLFHPRDSMRRDEAVAVLIRALRLADFAASLSPEEAQRLLAPFRDRSFVQRSLVPEIALAVKLRILIGYPDGTLRPAQPLRRSEAAAVIYRSTLFQLTASPNPFTPDGDGVEDETIFTTRTLKNRSLVAWQAFVGTLSGQPLRHFNRWASGSPPSQWRWDGKDDRGIMLAPGTYYYWGWARDQAGNVFTAPMKPISLEERTLRGSVTPAEVEPGGTLTVQATTAGRASAVIASVGGWPTVRLTPAEAPSAAYANSWTGLVHIPLEAGAGPYALELSGLFPDVTRRLILGFAVRPRIVLEPGLRPNPAVAGTRITATAATSPNVERVRVRWPWGAEQELRRAEGGGWTGTAVIPVMLPPGPHDVIFTAEAPRGRKEATLTLVVRRSGLDSVEFVLTD